MDKQFQQWTIAYQEQNWSMARFLLKDEAEAEDAALQTPAAVTTPTRAPTTRIQTATATAPATKAREAAPKSKYAAFTSSGATRRKTAPTGACSIRKGKRQKGSRRRRQREQRRRREK